MDSKGLMADQVKKVAKSKWSWFSVLLVIIAVYIAFQVKAAIDSLEYSLTPPKLPHYEAGKQAPEYLNSMGWQDTDSVWFHNASQGTATLPIPYDWLTALEVPRSNPWFSFFGRGEAFIGDYILRLGFIKQEPSITNPDALPIGLAITPSIYFEGINRKDRAVGFTCAACHTGQLLHDNKRYIVDGGPATLDLGLLTQSLGAALGQTALSSKFPILNGRFDRFAKNVLGGNYNVLTRNNLKKELIATLEYLVTNVDIINVTEGFTRLDALNRIGNQVFSNDMDRPSNYSPISAPVNYPHIWTTSWFDWVQYDGSIMQPLVRNAGEALGVSAFVDTTGPKDQRFASSVNVNNLVAIERWLAGTNPRENNAFNGLQAPRWPASFPAVNPDLAKRGEGLYQELCQSCHLPTIDQDAFWSDEHWQKIRYGQDETDLAYLNLNIIPLQKIGTDAAQATVLPSRTVDVTGLELDTYLCTPVGGKLDSVLLSDSATANFGLALGAFVEHTNKQWFKQNYVPEADWAAMEGGRPNCLQVGQGYKARPLNGVWATAPFLHNGSVPTVYDLLSPQAERPTFVLLGDQRLDTRNLGVLQTISSHDLEKKYGKRTYKETPDYLDGWFLLDTRQPGNHNTGHLFDDAEGVIGRIGRTLSQDERMALVEYIKSL